MFTKDSVEWIPVGTFDELVDEQPVVVRGADRQILVFRDGEGLRAVDNRCPHMGFPLNKGTLNNGMVTCYWHHARFDGESGCTFDLFADDVPVYNTKIEDGIAYVESYPRVPASKSYFRSRLDRGIEQNISIVISKSIIGLLEAGATIEELVEQLVDFGQANHESWSSGMTMTIMAANLWPFLSDNTRAYFAVEAALQLASDCAGQASRRDRLALEGNQASLERLRVWSKGWAQVRQRDGLERTLLTVVDRYGVDGLGEILFDVVNERIYSSTGHVLDFSNKAMELVELLGEEKAQAFLPILVPSIAQARGAEERSSWRSPVDLIELIHRQEDRLKSIKVLDKGKPLPDDFRTVLLGDVPSGILDTIIDALEEGVDPCLIAREIAYAASLRLAWFPQSNDIGDWFNPVHTFNFAHAVHRGLLRSKEKTFAALRGLLSGAMSVYLDRFLNIPPARIPGKPADLEGLPEEASELLSGLKSCLDSTTTAMKAGAYAVAYLRKGYDASALVDALVFLTLREDLDFHKMQNMEAAVRESQHWPEGSVEREHLYLGAIRYLAAHCPTQRSRSKMTQIAIRLQRKEAIFEG
ncbi:MAG: Rieske (2Fe-2S) protein [Opitutales bacterium]